MSFQPNLVTECPGQRIQLNSIILAGLVEELWDNSSPTVLIMLAESAGIRIPAELKLCAPDTPSKDEAKAFREEIRKFAQAHLTRK